MIEVKIDIKGICALCKKEIDSAVYLSGNSIRLTVTPCVCVSSGNYKRGYEKGYSDGEGREI
jgi:hypothetical protein